MDNYCESYKENMTKSHVHMDHQCEHSTHIADSVNK